MVLGTAQALEEPSLGESSKTQKTESYRFLWLRTFHHPVAIRIDVNADGTSRLTKKISSGAGGYAPGKLIENDTMALTKEQADWFLREIEGNKFWQLPSIQETPGGCDGSGVGHSGNQELVLPLGGSMDTKRRRSPRHRIGDDERVGQTKSAC